jgi:hypothetical protein
VLLVAKALKAPLVPKVQLEHKAQQGLRASKEYKAIREPQELKVPPD